MSLRRWLFRITLCLVLGVMTTVAVAWGCLRAVEPAYYVAVGVDAPELARIVVTSSGNVWEVDEWNGLAGGCVLAKCVWIDLRDSDVRQWTADVIDLERHDDTGYHGLYRGRRSISSVIDARKNSGALVPDITERSPNYRVIVCRRLWGFPARTIQSEAEFEDSFSYRSFERSQTTIEPLATGVIVNSFFYAAIWFTLLFAPRDFNRWNRKRRGLCPMCKYNLRGNPEGVTGCAECGWGREDFNAESPPEGARSEDSSSFEEQQA